MSKKLKKVAVIGHFAFGKDLLNGQTVKTKILADELEKQFGEGEITRYDTHGGAVATLRRLSQKKLLRQVSTWASAETPTVSTLLHS